MAKEIINLCPEKIVFSNNTIVGKSVEYLLSQPIPLCVGATYVIPRQVNHAQTFKIGDKSVNSIRLFIGELVDGELVAIRTVSVLDLKAQYYPTNAEVPAMVGKNGGWTTDRANAPKKNTASEVEVNVVNGRAQILKTVVVTYNGQVEGWTESFTDLGAKKVLNVKDDKVVLTSRPYKTWDIQKGANAPKTIKEMFIEGMPECEQFLL